MPIVARLMESRGSIENPNTSLASPAAWLQMALGGEPTFTGKSITEFNAVETPALYSAVRNIAEDIGKLPLKTYRRLDGGGKEPARDHRLYPLLRTRPNPEMSAHVFKEALQGNALLWGNGYAEIERDGGGRPVALWPIRADRVTPKRIRGRKVYIVRMPSGEEVPLAAELVFHMHGFGWDGLKGLSPVQAFRQALALAKATEEFGARWFSNASRPSGVIQGDRRMSDEGHQRLIDGWERMHKGLSNSHRVAILEEGFTWQQIGIPPEDAQFLETRKFSDLQMAQIYRMPPHKIGQMDAATFSNIEHQGIEYVTDTLLSWANRWQQEADHKLVATGQQSEIFVEFLFDALVQGDLQSRYEAYAVGRQNGWLSANDIRALENMNPIEGGDVYLVPLNMTDATQLGSGGGGAAPDDGGDRTLQALKLLLRPGPGLVESGPEGPRLLPRPAIEQRRQRSLTNRRRLQREHQRIFEDAGRRFVRREVEAAKAAIRRFLGERDLRDFDEWIGEFYPDHKEYIAQTLAPFFTSYARLVYAEAAEEVGGSTTFSAEMQDELREFIELVADRNISSSIGQLRSIAGQVLDGKIDDPLEDALTRRLDEWSVKRPSKFALRESVTLAGLASTTAYVENRVERKRWVSFGENCPLCDEMDGRVVGISRPFLRPGEKLDPGETAPLELAHAVPYPQLHNGCDCGIMSD